MVIKQFILLLTIIANIGFVKAQYTPIPDSNFEQALIDLNIDSEGVLDAQVLTLDIDNVLYLNVSNKEISNLEGIEDFIHLNTLICDGNSIDYLNLNQNINITYLSCEWNSMHNLQITNCINLEYLYISDNYLTNIDLQNLTNLKFFISEAYPTDNIVDPRNTFTTLNFSNNLDLTHINCSFNEINNIVFGNNDKLIYLNCGYNNLTSVHLESLTGLKTLLIHGNDLTELNLTQNVNLEDAFIGSGNDIYNDSHGLYNSFIELDLSQNINLKKIDLTMCFLDLNENMELDLSNCPILENVVIDLSRLNFINIANGNNSNLEVFSSLWADPVCIQVDNDQIANIANTDQNNWREEDGAFYSSDCSAVNNINTEQLVDVKIYPNPVIDNLYLSIENSKIKKIILYDFLAKKIGTYSEQPINLSKLEEGVFLIKIFLTDNSTIFNKIIKK